VNFLCYSVYDKTLNLYMGKSTW